MRNGKLTHCIHVELYACILPRHERMPDFSGMLPDPWQTLPFHGPFCGPLSAAVNTRHREIWAEKCSGIGVWLPWKISGALWFARWCLDDIVVGRSTVSNCGLRPESSAQSMRRTLLATEQRAATNTPKGWITEPNCTTYIFISLGYHSVNTPWLLIPPADSFRTSHHSRWLGVRCSRFWLLFWCHRPCRERCFKRMARDLLV